LERQTREFATKNTKTHKNNGGIRLIFVFFVANTLRSDVFSNVWKNPERFAQGFNLLRSVRYLAVKTSKHWNGLPFSGASSADF
jgi:hypothetical protein